MIILKCKPKKSVTKKEWVKCVNPFVCLSDIVHNPIDMDYVVFNPFLKDKDEIKRMIYIHIKDYFGYELSETELDHLSSLKSHECGIFIDQIRKILYIK